MQVLPPEFDWLADGLLLSLVLGLLLSTGVGVLMLWRPSTLFAIDRSWSRWIDTSRQFKSLDRPRSTERLFYRYHRLAGSLITLGAAFVLWEWAFAYDRARLLGMLGGRWARPELSWLVAAGEWIVVGLHVVILGIGPVIAFRPSLLKRVETEGNRWHEPQLAAAMDRVFNPLERNVQLHPRLAGLFLLLASSWCLAGLLPRLLGRLG